VRDQGYRNAVAVLGQLGLAQSTQPEGYSLTVDVEDEEELKSVVREAAEHDGTLRLVIEYLDDHPASGGQRIGRYVSEKYSLSWSGPSELRNGNALKMWASWLMAPAESPPPGPRVAQPDGDDHSQKTLFDET
jgi:hypothetical protein